MAAAEAVTAVLRSMPGGAALDAPVLEYLAGALVDLADVREGGAEAAAGACARVAAR